ncbi:pyruvate:ferredoxin (flavodoxin) oxidoreductase [Lacticaseibacillus sp. GG6-2]
MIDGNTAVARMAYAFSDAAAIYPITPSSGMAESFSLWATQKQTNAWQQVPEVVEMQSELGVAGLIHGLSQAGLMATSFTSSQGLLLMKPTLYKLAGEGLPATIHVAARSLATGSLNVFGEHSDVMSIRDTGCIILAASSVQQAALLAAVAQLSSIALKLPIIHFFDGFDISHELRKITLPSASELADCWDLQQLTAMRQAGIDNHKPDVRGGVQPPASYYQIQEATNPQYDHVPEVIELMLTRLGPLFATHCELADYTGATDATTVMITMGAVADTVEEVVTEANCNGAHWGALDLHLYRPLPAATILAKLPATVTKLIVLDRTKSKGAVMEPLAEDISALLQQAHRPLHLIHGRFGLGGKTTRPDQIRAAFIEAERATPKSPFTLGINDDITHLSLPGIGDNDLTPVATFSAKTYGKGYDGAISGSRHTLAIIGALTPLDVQGRFSYDARRSNNLTVASMRISPSRIQQAYDPTRLQMVLCYCDRYLLRPNLLAGLCDNGILLVNTAMPTSLTEVISAANLAYMRDHHVRVFTVDATGIAQANGIAPHTNSVMQAAFFALTDFVDYDTAVEALTAKIKAGYASDLNEGNRRAIAQTRANLHAWQIPTGPVKQPTSATSSASASPFEQRVYAKLKTGAELSVRDVIAGGMQAGALPLGTAANDKSGLASQIPLWWPEHCLQCNLCATVCPHAAIRPVLIRDGQEVPFTTAPAKDYANMQFRIQVSPEDCTGCQVCVDACPMKGQALTMAPIAPHRRDEGINWHIAQRKAEPITIEAAKTKTVAKLQYNPPLVAFSGACGGCGETAYLKMLTQMFPDNLAIANATGCSSIWGSSAPSIPWMKNPDGSGPVWASSLFENNAEYGLGMHLGRKIIQTSLSKKLQTITQDPTLSQSLRDAADVWLKHPQINANAQSLITALQNDPAESPIQKTLLAQSQFFFNQVQWLVGGDGWAYDIGTSGIDRILSRGDDVNILILDNEGYANTGGQSSTATPVAAKNKFAPAGHIGHKKDLPAMFMTYPQAYVAQVCLGANPEQTFKAFKEAAAYPGPAIIFAYSPCILHGLINHSSLIEEKQAVASGYWSLFRRQPASDTQPPHLMLDSKAPHWEQYPAFLAGDRRFNTDATAKTVNQLDAKTRFDHLK